ncbi:MAG: tRNA adenosine(34) deaminase TadA [Rhodoferax sp.]|nr:MAG: tRNA adenosine(34) deaminase TadA [Rhodoferax sp.]
MQSHEYFMRLALEQAQVGETLGEVPVGAVLTLNDQVIAVGHNQTISQCDPTAHAEIVAIRAAAQTLGNYRLSQCTMYVTLEPCAMCMGAILHGRIAKLYFAASDPKTGACGSVLDIPAEPQINHHCEVHGGLMQTQCAEYLAGYFQRLRSKKQLSSGMHLREDALRVDLASLVALMPKSQPTVVNDLPALQGLRMQIWGSPQSSVPPKHLILCLHGATSWSYIYRDLLSADIPPDWCIWAVDLPGHGGSDKTKRGGELLDLTFQVKVLKELLERSDFSCIHIVAQDTGCELALHLAAATRLDVSGLTLLNPACADVSVRGSYAYSILSRRQFAEFLNDLSDGDVETTQALCTPYPDAGHMTGMLSRLNATVDLGKLPPLPAAKIPDAVAYVGPKQGQNFRLFQDRFKITFQESAMADTSIFLGLKNPLIWDGVFRQLRAHG